MTKIKVLIIAIISTMIWSCEDENNIEIAKDRFLGEWEVTQFSTKSCDFDRVSCVIDTYPEEGELPILKWIFETDSAGYFWRYGDPKDFYAIEYIDEANFLLVDEPFQANNNDSFFKVDWENENEMKLTYEYWYTDSSGVFTDITHLRKVY